MAGLHEDNFQRLTEPHAEASSAMREMARLIPLAVSFPASACAATVKCGARLSQKELHRRGLRGPVDPACDEQCLGTANDVFTYASTFRYRPGACTGMADPAGGIGLLFSHAVETLRAKGSCTATPFDSGAVFKYLRPSDTREAQEAFVRDHELPVPGYRDLLARYLQHCFDAPSDYLSDVGPNAQWPLHVEGGDARRWTFEVRFPEQLSINEELEAAFYPSKLSLSESLQTQWDKWEASGTKVRSYMVRRDVSAFDSLEQEGRKYIGELLGIR